MTTDGSLQGTRVLIAHADAPLRRGAGRTLEELGCAVTETGDAAAALAGARRSRPDVMVLDAGLTRGDGYALLREIKTDPDLFRIAVVLWMQRAEMAEVLETLEHGAHDMLLGNVCAPELAARVRAARRAQEMQELLLSREQVLEDLAYHDDLTGLPNRRFVLRQLRALLSRSRRHRHDLAVLLIDVDHFKALNDEHGHLAGDGVLCEVATRLRARPREEDLVARFGGEEFLVVAPDTGPAGAASLAEDLRLAVAGRPFAPGPHALNVTVSIGWASWEDDEDLEGLLGRADVALYAAKSAGRDCVRPAPTRLRAM